MIAAICVAIAFAFAAPAPTAAATAASAAAPTPTPAAPVAWQGVTLGETVADVIGRLGAPASRRKAIMGTYLLEYKALGGVATLSLTDGGGTITGIRLIAADAASLRQAPADPFGVSIGDSADRLTQLRGLPQRYDDEG